jgi:hypothetical protein
MFAVLVVKSQHFPLKHFGDFVLLPNSEMRFNALRICKSLLSDKDSTLRRDSESVTLPERRTYLTCIGVLQPSQNNHQVSKNKYSIGLHVFIHSFIDFS